MATSLASRRRTLISQIRSTTADRLARLWDQLGVYTDDQKAQWAAAAFPVLHAGQSRAIDVQIAYLTAVLGPITFDRASMFDKASVDLSQPFIALATAFGNGADFTAAVTAGRDRAETVGEDGVTWAWRAANAAADPLVSRWQRIPEPGACDWCVMVAGQTYETADSASFGHTRCDCDIEAVP